MLARLRLDRVFREPGQVLSTAALFIVLHELDLLGNLPLWVLLSILVASGLSSTAIHARWGGATDPLSVHERMACAFAGTGAVIYATGWGPLLAVGYVLIVAQELKQVGSVAATPAMVWSVVTIAAGQAAIALSVAPSVVDEPLVQGLGALSVLGLLFVIHVLAKNTVEIEEAVNERRQAEASLAYRTMHDALTDLPNRALLLDRLGQALTRSRRRSTAVAVLHVDIDRFKLINDSFGHDAGDDVLLAVADRIHASLRPDDTLARFSSDEFVVCCEDISSTGEALAVAERIHEELRQPIQLLGQDAVVSVSIGVAVRGGDARLDAAGLLRDAEAAMHRAKEGGRNSTELFDEEMRHRALGRLQLEGELRRAIEDGELEVHYQPEIGLQTGVVTGVEALVRWRHPERGLLPPSEFIPLAEECGLITDLDRSVLRTACREVAGWQHGGVQVAVNVSGGNLEDPDLPTVVAGVLSDTGLRPELLCLEITESVFVADAARVRRQLAALHHLGVGLAVDDFGTGYSSLRYLKHFPIHTLKIDRAFVSDLERGHRDVAIVRAVVALAHALDLSVVAEGIETAEQLAILESLGCELGQGYLWSPPIPPERAHAFVLERAGQPEAR